MTGHRQLQCAAHHLARDRRRNRLGGVLDLLKGFSEWLNGLRQAGVTVFGYNLANLPSQLDPAKYERLVFGAVLILMMIFRPEGLLPEKRHKLEAAAEETAEQAGAER